jgi:hypothetical protein
MANVNRVVVGRNGDGKGAVILRNSPNHQEVPEIFWRSTLWNTTELPVDNTVEGDRAAGHTAREPQENGLSRHGCGQCHPVRRAWSSCGR